ncbi:glucan endo-1,3-beta-glucosidase [Musa troglodytarum]|uniref:Glucan endo-1,3-beta-glucosidase n=1 Tax=Musa troglodytarum TaxID=320322 RepID=A0A9E7JZ32_9LILI|nr:glucan endo-1,3-beta-glucosidase [Musa troglodytarum]
MSGGSSTEADEVRGKHQSRTECAVNSSCHGDCIFPGSKRMNVTVAGMSAIQTSKAGASFTLRLRTGTAHDQMTPMILNILVASILSWTIWS